MGKETLKLTGLGACVGGGGKRAKFSEKSGFLAVST